MEETAMFAYVSIIVLLTPFLSYMLFDFMQDGMIFQKYGKWLDTINETVAKPLGKCLKCFHIWVAIIVSIIFGISLSKFIISIGLSYVILVKLFYD